MSYDLHITKAVEWHEEEVACVTREEWLAMVDEDPDLAVDEANSEKGGNIFTVWNPDGSAEDALWIDWTPDGISARHMGTAHCQKMVQIAKRFGAEVQGDDGEVYGADGQPDWREPRTQDSAPRKPSLGGRIRRFFGR